jgi:hypothetical protein
MKRIIFFASIIIVLFGVHFYIGTPITLFLSVTIMASLLYYIASMWNEQQIEKIMLQNPHHEEAFVSFMILLKNKRFALMSFMLLGIVFISSIYCIKKVVNPTSEEPWFLNADHHALQSTAIGFKAVANFTIANDDSVIKSSGVTFFASEKEYELQTHHLYKPIFQLSANGKLRLVNPMFAKKIEHQFSIKNESYDLTVRMKDEKNRCWYKPWQFNSITHYVINLRCIDAQRLTDLGIIEGSNDSFSFTIPSISKGMKLSALLQSTATDDLRKPETALMLQDVINGIGDTYLLVDYDLNEQKSYSIFPSVELVDANCCVEIDGEKMSLNTHSRFTLNPKESFYIGFGNHKNLMRVDTLNHQYAISFDSPLAYYFSNSEKVKAGTKCSRFVTNQLNELVQNPLEEGFYMQHAYLQTNDAIRGGLDFFADCSNKNFKVNYMDLNSSLGKWNPIKNQQFILKSISGNLYYYFKVRNFAENRFSCNHLILYGIFLFLLFMSVMLFKRGKKLERIEPILWATIYSLIMLRFILYWRLATFPPLESITKFELENTLIGFDFSLFGIPIPFPATLFFTSIVVLFIVFCRNELFVKIRFPRSFVTWLTSFELKPQQEVTAIYAIFLALCVMINLFVGIDFLKRIITILLPLLVYIFTSIKMNALQSETKFLVNKHEIKFVQYGKSFLHYLIHNPTFYITTLTIVFFALADRGFCVLFFLFILLKNVLLNFLKKSFDADKTNLKGMFLKPWQYWIYGILSLVAYLVVLGFKSLFYYLLLYKLFVLGIVLFFFFLIIHVFYKTKKNVWQLAFVTLCIFIIAMVIPITRQKIDNAITEKIKFVQHRASIIHQPISQLLQDNPYTSFNTKKIIETAENQWFINSYISKNFDHHYPINLQKFSKLGVNYNTQTRDVVVARFIIGELGGYTMMLLLGLFIMPLMLYLLSFKLKENKENIFFHPSTYAGLIPLLVLFTISLFVWLTSTNRFVFFGQDFPFLSLTSRLSVLMPLLLFAFVLIQKPLAFHSLKVNLKLGSLRYVLLLVAIISFGYTTVRNNELSNENFSVIVENTKTDIDLKFNALLQNMQSDLAFAQKHFSYNQFAQFIVNDSRYKFFRASQITDKYSKSIFNAWEKNPASAMQTNNPLYFRFDKGKYFAEYNKCLYLALPVTDNKQVWHGKIIEASNSESNFVMLKYGNKSIHCKLPYYDQDVNTGIELALLPPSWLGNSVNAIALVNVNNQYKNSARLQIQKICDANVSQSSTQFVNTIHQDDIAFIQTNAKKYPISFNAQSEVYAFHKWVNNEYRTIYPQLENNFWIFHFANTLRPLLKTETNKSVAITLDYNLSNLVQKKMLQTYKNVNLKNRNFMFSVIAADGDGHIRLMNDFVRNRKVIDANDKAEIYNLQQQHFFYSNTKNERNQWGNANLLNLHLGPGSSIKPLVMACVSSQANIGWQYLNYLPAPRSDKETYAGLKLSHPWKNEEHYVATSQVDIPFYIQESSNYFHSMIMFLGSYKRSSFGSDTLGLKNILVKNGGNQNEFPALSFQNKSYFLPNYRSGNWPKSSENNLSSSFFANENSILANGFNVNANLSTSDNDKLDGSPMNTMKTYFVDSSIENKLRQANANNSIWSLPEASSFPQKMRHYISSKKQNEINENFNLGLKTATLGGYPYQITPFKMLSMYNALFTYNKAYSLSIMPQIMAKKNWQIDSLWTMNDYKQFLANNVFEGMMRVVTLGTGKELKSLRQQFPQFYFYAKTGTINESNGLESSSRRLIVSITNKDMRQADNIGNAKVYSFYFVVDSHGDFDWSLLRSIITLSMESHSFKRYFLN